MTTDLVLQGPVSSYVYNIHVIPMSSGMQGSESILYLEVRYVNTICTMAGDIRRVGHIIMHKLAMHACML